MRMLLLGVVSEGEQGGKLVVNGGRSSSMTNIYMVLRFTCVVSFSPHSSITWHLRGRDVKGLHWKAAFPTPQRAWSPCCIAYFSALGHCLFTHPWYKLLVPSAVWTCVWWKGHWREERYWEKFSWFCSRDEVIETTLRGLRPGLSSRLRTGKKLIPSLSSTCTWYGGFAGEWMGILWQMWGSTVVCPEDGARVSIHHHWLNPERDTERDNKWS